MIITYIFISNLKEGYDFGVILKEATTHVPFLYKPFMILRIYNLIFYSKFCPISLKKLNNFDSPFSFNLFFFLLTFLRQGYKILFFLPPTLRINYFLASPFFRVLKIRYNLSYLNEITDQDQVSTRRLLFSLSLSAPYTL